MGSQNLQIIGWKQLQIENSIITNPIMDALIRIFKSVSIFEMEKKSIPKSMHSQHSKPRYLLKKAHQKNNISVGSFSKSLSRHSELNFSTENFSKMNATTNFQNSSFESVEKLQGQIRDVLSRINIERKRKANLTLLNHLISSQLLQKEQNVENSQCVTVNRENKLTLRLNLQISKILEKLNNQVADISIMKSQIKAKRQERVVFSNLLRNIEIELRSLFSKYQELILLTEQSKCQLQQSNSTVHAEIEERQQEEETALPVMGQHSEQTQLTVRRKPKKKFTNLNRTKTQNTEQNEKLETVFSYLKRIKQYKFELRKFYQFAGISDLQSIKSLSQEVQSINESVFNQIQQMDCRISQIQQEARVIENRRRDCQIIEVSRLPNKRTRTRAKLTDKIDRKSGNESQFKNREPVSVREKSDEQIVKLLVGQFFQSSQAVEVQKNLSLLDERVEDLCFNSQSDSPQLPQLPFRTNTPKKQDKSKSNVVDKIIQQMSTASNERLYKRTDFEEAYQREFSKSLLKSAVKKKKVGLKRADSFLIQKNRS